METRMFAPELEVRSMSKRLLCGIVVPYGVDQRIDDTLTERFEAGAFNHQLRAANRVGLYHLHSNDGRSLQLGFATELRDDPAGLYGEFRVVDQTAYGDHYLALVREGALREWSIGFEPMRDRAAGRTTVRVKAMLKETALVPQGAYGELAAVGQVRAALPKLRRDELLARLPKPTFPA